MIKKPVFFTKRNALILQGKIIAKTGYRTRLISQEILHKIVHLKYSGIYINIQICEYLKFLIPKSTPLR